VCSSKSSADGPQIALVTTQAQASRDNEHRRDDCPRPGSLCLPNSTVAKIPLRTGPNRGPELWGRQLACEAFSKGFPGQLVRLCLGGLIIP
jgi:hypothetical protein